MFSHNSVCLCPYCSLNLGKPTITYAEENIFGWISQPANTISNLAYIMVALVVIFQIYRKKLPWYFFGFPIVYMLIGLSSAFYYASATFVGQFFDFASIYLFASYILFLAINQRKYIKSIYLAFIISLCGVGLCVTMWFVPELRIWLFAILQIIPFLYFEFTSKAKHTYRYLKYALFVFLCAWSVWWLDVLFIWDYKTLQHYINGHAVWHILTAISLYFISQYYMTNYLDVSIEVAES